MIIIEPLGGLGNRMRVIASGIWLKQKLGARLVVIWKENYELNCPYHLLFESSPEFIVHPKDRKYNYLRSSNQNGPAKEILAAVINKLIGIDYCILDQDFYNLVFTNKLDVYQAAKSHKVTYIQTCQAFGDNLFAFKYLKPVLAIREKISQVSKQFTNVTIGVHIRRTDHVQSIAYSLVDSFINKMHAELVANKDSSFFLCTDDPEVEQAVLSVFGGHVIVYHKERTRQTVKGMQDAVIDLFCLSRTQKILGSYWSSYGEVASVLNNIKLEVVKK